MNTDTPRTDEWETYCDESYYHLWRVRRKNERGFNDGYHVHNGDEARALVDLLNKQDSELTAASDELAEWHDAAESVKAEYPDEVHCTCVPILRKQIKTLTEQRDELAEALRELWKNHTLHGAAYELIEQTLAAVKGGSDE